MPPQAGHSPGIAIMHRYPSRASTSARALRCRLVLPPFQSLDITPCHAMNGAIRIEGRGT